MNTTLTYATGKTAKSAVAPHMPAADLSAVLRRTGIKPKLRVGAVDDPAEAEAVRVADSLIRMPDSAASDIIMHTHGTDVSSILRRQSAHPPKDMVRRQAVNSFGGLCIKSFFGGEVIFHNLPASVLADIAVINEDTGAGLTRPVANGVTYNCDGFWYRPRPEWFKIPDHCRVDMHALSPSSETYGTCCNVAASLRYEGPGWATFALDDSKQNPFAGTSSASPPHGDTVHRKCAACEEEDKFHRKTSGPVMAEGGSLPGSTADMVNSLGQGQPLPTSERAYFEPRFGHPLDHVRLHTSPQAQAAAQSIGARAFALGNDVAFAEGEYRPGTHAGRSLLAHEIAHVVQGGPALRRQVSGGQAEAFSFTLRRRGLPAEVHNNEDIATALLSLRRFTNRLDADIAGGNAEREHFRRLWEDQWIVSRASDLAGGVRRPHYQLYDTAAQQVAEARRAIERGDVRAAVSWLEQASTTIATVQNESLSYREGTMTGAERMVFGLQVTAAVSATVVTVGSGGTAAAALGVSNVAGGLIVGTTYGVAQNLAGQAAAVHLGQQSSIDWGGLAFDAFLGAVLNVIGARAGAGIVARFLRNPAFATASRQLLLGLASDILTGELQGLLHQAARMVFDNARGRENLTFGQAFDRIIDTLLDPRQHFLNIITASAGRRMQAHVDSLPPPQRGTRSAMARLRNSVAARALSASMNGVVDAVPATRGTGASVSAEVLTQHVPVQAQAPDTLPHTVAPAHEQANQAPLQAAQAAGEHVQAVEQTQATQQHTVADDIDIDALFANATAGEPQRVHSGRRDVEGAILPQLQAHQRQAASEVVGQRMNQQLADAWNQCATPAAQQELAQINQLLAQGQTATARARARTLYDGWRGRFWARVRSAGLTGFFTDAGMQFAGGNDTAPLYVGSDGRVYRLTLEHFERLSDNPMRAVDASNFLFSIGYENSVILEAIRRVGR